MKYFLDFQSDSYGKKTIDEPFGASGINFSLIQKPDGMGRDISFSGGEITFEFTFKRDHQLKQLLYYRRKFGFEATVILTIEIDELNSYTADLDFATSETDDLEYFKCKAIEDSKLQIVKGRRSVKVDVLSNADVDGNYIAPLVPENILMLAKPVIQNSEWDSVETFGALLETKDDRFYSINSAISLTKSSIEDTFTFFSTNSNSIKDFELIKAKTELKNVVIDISIPNAFYETFVTGGGNGFLEYSFDIYYGNGSLNTNALNRITLLSKTTEENIREDISIVSQTIIPLLNAADSIYISHNFRLRQSAVFGSFQAGFSIGEAKIAISVSSRALNSVSQSVRLVDVMRQVIKSISGLDISAPRFEAGGQFYDNRLVNGNFLRNRQDKPFTVSLEDLEKSLTEFKGDYEISSDGKVFFGIEADFYTSTESGFFDNTQFSEMSKTFNPKFTINEFGFKYNKYQSLKEAEETNSADVVHGESKLVFFNKNVENKKEIEVDWIRDAFLIEATRRKAITLTDATASQDDDDLFCVDTIVTTFDNQFTEVSELQHTFNNSTQKLSLRNDGTINFIALGIQVGSILLIIPTDTNAGTYSVFGVTGGELILTRLLGATGAQGNGVRSTKYTYSLSQDFVPFTNYTNQGFTEITGLNSPQSYSNLRYSIARNVYNYYQAYLATCNIFWKNRPLKNAFYKNNGEYSAKFNNVTLKENADLVAQGPILTPEFYNSIVFANVEFEDFIILSNRIRSERGFIRTLDNLNSVIKIYPTQLDYTLLEKELIIKGEEKYEPTSLTISTAFNYILVNNETRVQALLYNFEGEKLFLFDENRYRLYNGVYWFEVAINGVRAESIEQLKQWLLLVI